MPIVARTGWPFFVERISRLPHVRTATSARPCPYFVRNVLVRIVRAVEHSENLRRPFALAVAGGFRARLDLIGRRRRRQAGFGRFKLCRQPNTGIRVPTRDDVCALCQWS